MFAKGIITTIGAMALTAQAFEADIGLQDAAQASNTFGWHLFQEITKEEANTENLLFSPLSAWLALSLASNGAESETLDQLAQVIEQRGWSRREANQAIQRLTDNLLTGQKTSEKLRIANAIWVNSELFDLSPQFHSEANTYYRILPHQEIARNEPFSDPQTLQNINDWVSESTNDMIPSILEELEMDMAVILLNALFFEGQWHQPFDTDMTTENNFYRKDGEITKVQMMRESQSQFQYAENSQFKMLSLSFRADLDDMQGGPAGRFRVDLVLPVAEKDNHLNFNQDKYDELVANLSVESVAVALPKFNFSYKNKLNNELIAAGMPRAFDRNLAQFKSLGTPKFGGNAYISDVLQKTAVEMDENGFKAAASTAVIVSIESAPVNDGLEFIADRPFYLALRDKITGAVLFQGLINDPRFEKE